MCKLLNVLGYRITGTNNKQFFGISIFDTMCLVIYTCISIHNLWTSHPSYVMWVLNLTIMGRIIAGNRIEEKELDEYYSGMKSPPVYRFVKWHTIKLTCEATSMVFATAIFLIGVFCENWYGRSDNSMPIWFCILGTVILVVSTCEDLLKILEKMYSAELPEKVNEENT